MPIKRKVLFYAVIPIMVFFFVAGLITIIFAPTWQQSSPSPGLGLLGQADHGEQELISYRTDDRGSVLKRAQDIDRHLSQYRMKYSNSGETQVTAERVSCSHYWSPPSENQVCDVPLDDFHPCTSSNLYNYEEGGPCVFLKLDNIVNWKPEVYNTTTNLPANMPIDLKDHIRMVALKPESNVVWVSCEGENPADAENLGPLQYIPRRGFPSYYYPFTNKQGYLSPLVAVLFEKPRMGVLINVVCKAWAKNIGHDTDVMHGSVRFALMVDRS